MVTSRGEPRRGEASAYPELISSALREDIGRGDITTSALGLANRRGRAEVRAKEYLVLAGIDLAKAIFCELDRETAFKSLYEDGARVPPGGVIAEVSARLSTLLAGERTALNFLQRLSGIATITAKWVECLKPYHTKLRDTRKTTPGWRGLEKYAVRCGGGENHRFGLYDGVLIKDNHIQVVGGVTQALKLARQNLPQGTKIEVEAENLSQVKEALKVGADVILLDNMGLSELRRAMELITDQPEGHGPQGQRPEGHRPKVEVSGGVTLENAARIAKLGVDYIAVGAITHSAKAVDIHMELLWNA